MASLPRFIIREFFIYLLQSLICSCLYIGLGWHYMLSGWSWDLIEELCIVTFLGLLSGFAIFPFFPFWCLATLGVARLVLAPFDLSFPAFTREALSLRASFSVACHFSLAFAIGQVWFLGFIVFFGGSPSAISLRIDLLESVGLPMNQGFFLILLAIATLGTSLGLWANEKWITRRDQLNPGRGLQSA
jgi:hypothetical protein